MAAGPPQKEGRREGTLPQVHCHPRLNQIKPRPPEAPRCESSQGQNVSEERDTARPRRDQIIRLFCREKDAFRYVGQLDLELPFFECSQISLSNLT